MLSQQAMCHNVRVRVQRDRPLTSPIFSSNFYVAPQGGAHAWRAVLTIAGAPQVATRGVEKILGGFRVFRVFRSGPNVPYPGTPKRGHYNDGPGELIFAGRCHAPRRPYGV